jgi:IS5 family transposase
MSVKTLDSRQMEHHLEENVVARLFLGIEGHLLPRVRDHSNIARAQT